MIPVICKARTETNDGLWANKMGGEFEEGDAALTKFTVEGRADIKELGGHLRVFFSDIKLKKRIFVLTEPIRAKMLEDYYEEKKRKKQAAYSLLPDAAQSDSDDDDDEEEKQRKEQIIVDGLVDMERMRPLEVPKLHLYLTSKKPKVRIVDAHTHGTKIRITGVKDSEGVFGNDFVQTNYEASLTDIPDALGYQGLVVLKLPESEPVTPEPVIYGIVKLQSHRTQRVRTGDALHLTEIAETLAKIMNSRVVKLDNSSSADAAAVTLKQKKELERQKAEKEAQAKAGGSRPTSPVPAEEELVVSKDVHDRVKPLHVYRQLANKVWADFQRPPSDEIDFATFLRFIDHLDIFLVTTQAKRIFDAVDVGGDGSMGMSEFENFLIALDILGGASADLVVMDAFDSLKSLPLAVLAKMKEQEEKRRLQEIERKKQEAIDATIQGKDKEKEKTPGAAKKPTGVTDPDSPLGSPGGPLTGSPIPAAAVKEAKALADKAAAAAAGMVKPKEKKKPPPEPGLDYSAFNEAVQLLGVKEEDDEVLREAFCFGGAIREKEADKKYLNLLEFRKAWLKLANVELEMTNRGLKYESGVFADSRNRERLTRAIADVEETYVSNLKKINRIVDHIKQERRQKKDQRRHEQEAHREKLLHEARKFMAVRSQEKRLKLKREQEERSKKRLEDKVLRNKLQLRQQENVALQRAEIAEANKRNEKLRQDEIRALGLDRLDYSVQKLRAVPPALYHDQDAQLKLSYVLAADFSHNILESLPGRDFLYWLSEVRMVKLSQNRLKTVPEEVRQMAHLEILELNTNRLEILPESLAQVTTLQRLDLSNNKLQTLPEEVGNLRLLRSLRVHSNHLLALPKSIGDCAKLEYVDMSNNKLVELPESMQHLVSLTHLNIATNRITGFPYHIGDCVNLAYIDASTNALTYIPSSFSALNKLEYCNFENNEIVTTANCFNNLTSLRYLNMRVNAARVLHADMGNMRNLTMLDLSVNAITTLPLELGLLRSLQELKLHRNQLVSIPPELGSCGLLQRLELPYNSLEGSLPDTIGLVTSLVHLNIAFNQVDGLPRSIVGLQQLQSINAERCLLSSLPDTFTYLDRLEVRNRCRSISSCYHCFVPTRFCRAQCRCWSCQTIDSRNSPSSCTR
jgi:Leucine-rich repeat (LRR) protein